MAVSFSTPPFSFIQLSEPNNFCSNDGRPCLPVADVDDLRFRVTARVTGADKATFGDLEIGASLTTSCDGAQLQNYSSTWELTEPGDGEDPDFWEGYFQYHADQLFSTQPVGQCLLLALFNIQNPDEVYQCFETCFQKTEDACYTSVLQYRNNENAFEFNYEDITGYNRVRLSLYPHSPTNSEEEKSYAKSNGSSTKLMHRLWKEFKIKTDYWPEEWIEKFAIATAHDDVLLKNEYANLNEAPIIRLEKVEPEWREEEIPGFKLAIAKTTIRLAAARATINNNCL